MTDDNSIDSISAFIQKYITAFFDGDSKKLESEFWRLVQSYLADGVDKGYDTKNYNGVTDTIMKNQLQSNVASFVAFKNYAFNNELTKLLVNENGDVRTWTDFKNEALKVSNEINKLHLKTEYDHAVGSSVMASKWQDFERNKHIYPNLKYVQIDRRTKNKKHIPWHGIILPINHSFWDTRFPPNDWGCACDVEQTDEDINTKDIDVENMPALPKMFNVNSGKQGIIFDESHPYFKLGKYDDQRVKKALETYKMEFPNYQPTESKLLQVSRWADKNDLKRNVEVANIIAEKLKINFQIRPHIEIEGVKNPEYLINDILADRKSIESIRGFRKAVDNSKEQLLHKSVNTELNPYSIVFDLDLMKNLDIDLLQREIEKKIHSKRGSKIHSLFFQYKGKAVELTREEIVNRDFSKLSKIK